MFTFKQYLAESKLTLHDVVKKRGDVNRNPTHYPKTTAKRHIDEWNTRMKEWAKHHEETGGTLFKRNNTGDHLVFDAYHHDQLISTVVIAPAVGSRRHNQNPTMFNFYNHEADPNNKYYKPEAKSTSTPWEYSDADMSELHYSDQRNVHTTSNPAKTAATHRKRDGMSLQDIVSSTRAK